MLGQGPRERRRRGLQHPRGGLERGARRGGLPWFFSGSGGLRGGHALRDEMSRQLEAWEVGQFEEPGVEARFLA